MMFDGVYFIMIWFIGFGFVEFSYQEQMYCGPKNCYDILNVSMTASKFDIQKSFRKLSLKLHPDKNKDIDTSGDYQELVRAYEILKDEDGRKDYDYYLEHPDEYYYNMYRYYRKSVQIDIRLVILFSMIIFSYIQHYMLKTRHESRLEAAYTNQKCRNWALQKIDDKYGKDAPKKNSNNYEKLLREYITSNVDSKPPTLRDLICVQIIFFPLFVIRWLSFYVSWHWKYTILSHEYDDKAKIYLTKKRLQIKDEDWDSYDEKVQLSFIEKELWINKNYKEYVDEINDEYHRNCLKSAKYKSLRRWLRSGGPGQMTFAED